MTYHDLDEADAIFVIGQNPGTNHPRMIETLRNAVKRGAQVVCFNPLKERGLERFQHPQNPLEMLTNDSRPTNTAYFRPALGGDMAALRGIAKYLLQWECEAAAKGGKRIFDHDFIAAHTLGMDDYLAQVDATSWELIERQSGLSLHEIEQAARMYARAEKVIICWAMGITQHRHSVARCRRSPTCSCSAARSASLAPVSVRCAATANVQGDRTMGIDEKAPAWLSDALAKRFAFEPPRNRGHNTVEATPPWSRGRPRCSSPWAATSPRPPRTPRAPTRRCANAG